MSDELVGRLQREWQSQPHDSARVLQRLRRNRWTPHLVLGLEIFGSVIALGVGVWFAWVATHQVEHKLLYTLSAATLLIAVPVLAVATAMARRSGLAWHDETPESILRIGKRRAEASLLAMRVGRWHIGVIAVFVAVLWVLQWLGFIQASEFLVLYSLVCLVVSLGSWGWMRWRTEKLIAERDACVTLLSVLATADDEDE